MKPEPKMILQFIEPFRKVPPYDKFRNHENQSIAILFNIMESKFLREGLQAYITASKTK
jgi:hypothetical protein